jgi:hypothetical protein
VIRATNHPLITFLPPLYQLLASGACGPWHSWENCSENRTTGHKEGICERETSGFSRMWYGDLGQRRTISGQTAAIAGSGTEGLGD